MKAETRKRDRVCERIRTASRALERHARGRHESGRGKRLVQQGFLLGAATAASARLDACRRRQQQHGAGGGVRRQESGEPREECAQRFARVKGALQRAAVGARDAKQRLRVHAMQKWQCRKKVSVTLKCGIVVKQKSVHDEYENECGSQVTARM
jgi:hypothetical protein